MKTTYLSCLLTGILLLLVACKTTQPGLVNQTLKEDNFPNANREFRAAWIATVANINWPSTPGLPVDKQKEEAVYLLDLLQKHNFNAAIFQVRPQADALYDSNLEPWSYYLTGEQGRPPEPYYDPLKFWIEEAHKRGLELHAWLNPYRAHHPTGGEVTEASIVKKRPDLVVELKNGYWWLDPALEGTQQHSTEVVLDLVKRYDLDGIHFDDYFYPYPSYNNGDDFPDDKSWAEYRATGGKLSRKDWRRESVNDFIQNLYQEIKATKPQVKFGLSPFGIWRPNHPESIKGFDQYDQLYADAKLWLNEGWIDYWTPQLYWPVNQIPQSYPVLLGWWEKENLKNRHLWPGMSIGRLKGEKAIDETLNQIMITRGMIPENPGNVHWSIGPLVRNEALVTAISEGPYQSPALVPASPWLDNIAPEPPSFVTQIIADSLKISWIHPQKDDVSRWVVYFKYAGDWIYKILPADKSNLVLPAFKEKPSFLSLQDKMTVKRIEQVLDPLTEVAISAVDRTGNESQRKPQKITEVNFSQAPSLGSMLAKFSKKPELPPTHSSVTVKLGIEVLLEDYLDLIQDKRVGLVTNPSAVTPNLESVVDVLANIPNVELVALFGAEHGIRGAKQGKIMQEGEPDPHTGIPIYSLYSDSYAPKQEWLDKIDVLLFDIQGVGSAWYTFKYSMSFAMEACAKAGVPFVVLDRPNPLGGLVVEGPFLNLGRIFRHKLPLRHGMTYGELAMMWNETENIGADLTVIPMKGWERQMMWNQTGLHWVMPSPNMGTLETAIAYPGQCLFERMNISEGRGTTKPFLLTGAPWVDGIAAANDLNHRGIPGIMFRPVYFIPQVGAASNPREKPWNKMCSGVEVMLTDYESYRPVATALHIIDAYRKTNPDSLQWSPPPLLKQIENPQITVEEVIEKSQQEVADFIEKRQEYLIYK